MEHSMVGAYMALLLGHAAGAAPHHARAVRARVPLYAPLLPTLNKYYAFLSLTASVSTHTTSHDQGPTWRSCWATPPYYSRSGPDT